MLSIMCRVGVHFSWRKWEDSFRFGLIGHAWNSIEGKRPVNCFQAVVPLAPRINCRQMMAFLFDYSPAPGQDVHSPSSRICIVSPRVLSLDLLPAVLALALPHFKFVFPCFYAKIPMDSSLSLCSKTLLFSFPVEPEAIENRRQLTSLWRNIFFFWINLSLDAVSSKSILSWNFPVIVWNL